jgi:putative SOS response-associated peptidase YedK
MCNRYANDPDIQATLSSWQEYIGWSLRPAASESAIQSLSLDIWPRRDAIIIRREGKEDLLDIMPWGIPLTLAGKRPGSTITKHVTNVRNLTSPFWRGSLAQPQQRCLVPFNRFAEPIAGAGRREAWFSLRDAPVAAFAGMWRQVDQVRHFAFLTCEPNPLVAAVHPKAMPVILATEDFGAWLDGADAHALAQPYPSQLMLSQTD